MYRILTPFILGLAGLLAISPAHALSTKECSAKYQAAKEAGTLGDMKWNDFRKAQCASDAAPATETKKAASKPAAGDTGGGISMQECSAKYQAAKSAGTLGGMKWNDFRKSQCSTKSSTAAPPAAPTKTTKAATANDSNGGGLSMQECSAKYQAAKSAGTLGGMKWNDFRKSQCSAGSSAAASPAAPTKTTKAAADKNSDSGGLTMKECSAKYQAAKEAGTLGDVKWNDFRKTQCSAGATTAASQKPAQAPKEATSPTASNGTGLSMKECSAKYQAAKQAGTLGGLKWNDFRKAECAAGASKPDDDDTAPTADTATYTQEPAAPTTAAPRGVLFPSSIATKYSTESPGKARMHTCLDQYYVNKERNSLGGLKWIQTGGGYYSLCNSRLKS